LAYGLVALALVGALAFAIAPLSRSFVQQWSTRDVESRSRLVYDTIQGPLSRAIAQDDRSRVQTLLDAVAKDERILAVGVCEGRGRLRVSTELMPRAFSCEKAPRAEGEAFGTMVNDGRRVLIASFPISVDGRRSYLVVLHDLSYLDARSGQAQAFVVAALVGVAVVVATVAAVLAGLVLRSWMSALRQGVEAMRAGRPQSSRGARTAVDAEIHKLLQQLKVARAPTEAPEVAWTPKTLQQLLETSLPGAEVIIVSNREPYIHNQTPSGVKLQTPASGLVSALEPIMRACGGTWIAHGSGSADKETVDQSDRVMVPPHAPEYTLRRVWISEEEQEGYYYGLANEGLWPLCHIAFVRPTFRESDWHAYERINRRFADAVAQEARTDDPIVLVQDYHFALAPALIRQRLPRATIITFWHIPWPNAETFGICPWKEQILEGLLGSTIIGFHTQFHCNNFFETVDRFMESRLDREHSAVTFKGHETLVRPYPISIDWPPKAMAHQAPVGFARARVRHALGLPPDARLGVGIERFDYTKGILDRMRAIDLLLERHPHWRGRFSFVQVAAPTRSKLPAYARLEAEALALAEDINSRHGAQGYLPIRLLVRHHEPEEVFELFRAADLCIVSSLHDGMNLVAKEFVAARDDEQGVLVLSNFAGAARELSEALIVNPYDGAATADALGAALTMPAQEQRERMRLMRQQVREQNVYRWAGRMLVDAAQLRQRRRILELTTT
jgi:trehalose 6-phosphate synthase